MQLEMIECPTCGNDFPKRRKELGYRVCINCSTVKPLVGITTIEGHGEDTYNGLIIMDYDQALAIARRASELSGQKAIIEILDFEADDHQTDQFVKERVTRKLEQDSEDDDMFNPNSIER
jgi:hypothetical protein|tara:strand:- start:3283 stop:3642 length:360 start_codon:yes stop_codon:yes gene_type:complete